MTTSQNPYHPSRFLRDGGSSSHLEGVLLVNDFEVEADALLQRDLALSLLVAPLIVDQAVSDDRLNSLRV